MAKIWRRVGASPATLGIIDAGAAVFVGFEQGQRPGGGPQERYQEQDDGLEPTEPVAAANR
jgi:hypothetical protein